MDVDTAVRPTSGEPTSSGEQQSSTATTTAASAPIANEELLQAIRRESPQDASSFHNCNFRVLSQFVAISDIDFKEQSFYNILKCASFADVLLPNEVPGEDFGRVTVNDEDAEYIRKDPLKILSHRAEPNLERLSHDMYDELEDCEGELLINVPESCYLLMDEQKVIRVAIDVKVIKPKHKKR
ncbi:unnamed protein product [Gongylonema pulchrum]|uniref:PIH1_CS domain-containing protein n=1 Tax=Gongylonema pulchrum TaxID=637853 RepID=A0A183D5Q2_9BILA|nr:unnamed protein product [Gongylonema pulchrum]